MRLKDLTGVKIGELLILERVEDLVSNSGRKYVKWKCKCSCGNTKDILSSNLLNGSSSSCGCIKNKLASDRLKNKVRDKLSEGKASFNILYSRYKSGAEKRGFTFELTERELEVLTSSDCYYCNAPPSQSIKGKRTNGAYLYNGIDREDNSHGYEYWNCVSCCKTCNFAKKDSYQEDFFEWIKRMVDYNKDRIF